MSEIPKTNRGFDVDGYARRVSLRHAVSKSLKSQETNADGRVTMNGKQKAILVAHLSGLLVDVLKKVGVLRQDVHVVGPELTLAAQQFLEHDGPTGPERIVAAAICMNRTGLAISLPRPARHCDVQRLAAEQGLDILGKHEQGFMTSDGRFVRRAPARRLADLAGQLKREPLSHVFTSEELW